MAPRNCRRTDFRRDRNASLRAGDVVGDHTVIFAGPRRNALNLPTKPPAAKPSPSALACRAVGAQQNLAFTICRTSSASNSHQSRARCPYRAGHPKAHANIKSQVMDQYAFVASARTWATQQTSFGAHFKSFRNFPSNRCALGDLEDHAVDCPPAHRRF